MAKVLVTESYLSAIASAIRSKAGTTQTFTPAQMASAIDNLPSGPSGMYIEYVSSSDGYIAKAYNLSSTTLYAGIFTFTSATAFEIDDPTSITHLGTQAFYHAKLRDITLPNVISIQNTAGTFEASMAFAGCSASTINLPALKSIIGSYTFQSCLALREINLPNLETITSGSYLFDGCSWLTSVSFPKLRNLPTCAFRDCTRLVQANLSVCSEIGQSAFVGTHLTSISAPQCQKVFDDSFFSVSSLATVSLPACHYIGQSAFAYCSGLSAVNLPALVSSWYSYVFDHCTSLVDVNLPAVTSTANGVFRGCNHLVSISLPSCVFISTGTFQNCTSLSQLSLPACRTIANTAFINCSSLDQLTLPVCSEIRSSAFANCYNLISLYLLSTEMCRLTSTASRIFSYTPINGYTASAGQVGSVFVPAALLSKYQNNMFWKTISSRIVALG